jgi:hypothetical protein
LAATFVVEVKGFFLAERCFAAPRKIGDQNTIYLDTVLYWVAVGEQARHWQEGIAGELNEESSLAIVNRCGK